MRTFNGPGPSDFARLSTQEIRREFLIDGLFAPGEIPYGQNIQMR